MQSIFRYLLSSILVLVLAAVVTLTALAEQSVPEPLPVLEVKPALAELGKRLFFDRRLSGDAQIACASCHLPENGFSHPDALAPGYPGNKHFRNAPTLINAAHKKIWLHDGRLGTNLNDVTRGMLTETYLMNMDMRIMQERLKQDPVYVEMFAAAGLGEPSNGGTRNAIPEYLKTLVSKNAPFDTGAMSAQAQRGLELFQGKAACARCHSGPLLSDGKRHNTGVPENFEVFLDPLRHQAFLAYAMFMGVENYMNLKRDPGAYVQTHRADKTDMGMFMTPSLRELKYTAPYMHNGMFATLREVVDFYNQGGGEDRNKDAQLALLGLSEPEKRALVAFLEALSGDPLTGPEYVWQESYPTTYDAIADWHKARN